MGNAGERIQTFSYAKQIRFRDLMYRMVMIVYCVVYLKFAKRIYLKSSHIQNGNYIEVMIY